MKKVLLTLLTATTGTALLPAQPDLTYYLPEKVAYNPVIPTPKSVIGHEVGEWHVSHDRLVTYMKALDQASDRITLEETGRTFEGRPLLLLTITSPANHGKIESLRQQHLQLADPSKSQGLDTRMMPAVFYMGFSIHGNEPSGANAGLLTAYYLAAAQGPDIEKTLENTIILFDPSFNPDGLHRFSSWVNSRKSKSVSPDPNDMEHNEPWPGGRTNHYWFDLNRDWLVTQMPESQARIRKYHQWKPNVLTDHHEMGTNATFFFMPGEPSRVHPLTPPANQEFTRRIGEYHARALNAIGSLYYSQEGYDDFYYGKGSTFPDIQGAIGILFEQASSRGHAQESVNGILRFPFTIRNQFTASLSTLQAVQDLRVELLNFQRDFFRSAVADAAKDPVKAFVFGSAKDKTRAAMLADLLIRQQVEVYKPAATVSLNGRSYDPENSYVVPTSQAQYRTIKAAFDRITRFKDSLFYDISSWTLPLAFGLEYDEMRTAPAPGSRITDLKYPAGRRVGGKSEYAYVIEPYEYYLPRTLNRLLRAGIRVKVATEAFHSPEGRRFERGSLLIPVNGQEKGTELIEFTLNQAAEMDGLDIYAFSTGLDYNGVSLGSSSFVTLRKPEIAMVTGEGISPNDAGEMWHLLDQRYETPVSMVSTDVINRSNLARYNTIILPPGNYSGITDAGKEKLKTWTQAGGVLIGFETALNWLTGAGLGKFEMKKEDPAKDAKARPYSFIQDDRGAQETSGAIFEAEADLTNPLFYGYYQARIPMFKSNNLFMEKSKGAYSNPLTYGNNPLMSGYISAKNYQQLKNSSVAGMSVSGQGRVIGFADGAAFRAFWFATNRMMMNAIYHGPFLNPASAR
jgi:hypothetical protein